MNSTREMMWRQEKFRCEKCHIQQEACKWMLVKHQPSVLILHMKRFKYDETLGTYNKLCYRVAFSEFLRLADVVSPTLGIVLHRHVHARVSNDCHHRVNIRRLLFNENIVILKIVTQDCFSDALSH